MQKIFKGALLQFYAYEITRNDRNEKRDDMQQVEGRLGHYDNISWSELVQQKRKYSDF